MIMIMMITGDWSDEGGEGAEFLAENPSSIETRGEVDGQCDARWQQFHEYKVHQQKVERSSKLRM